MGERRVNTAVLYCCEISWDEKPSSFKHVRQTLLGPMWVFLSSIFPAKKYPPVHSRLVICTSKPVGRIKYALLTDVRGRWTEKSLHFTLDFTFSCKAAESTFVAPRSQWVILDWNRFLHYMTLLLTTWAHHLPGFVPVSPMLTIKHL